MIQRDPWNVLMSVLAIIGAIALLFLVAMWLMMGTMMGGGMMNGGMMGGSTNCCSGGMVSIWLLGLLVVAGLVAGLLLVVRRR